MNKQDVIEFKLSPALQECQQHWMRLHSDWQEAIAFPAIRGYAEAELTDEQVRTLDQLVLRFGKLQDAIGARFSPVMLHFLQEWHEHEAFLDKLNRAEKLGILPSAGQWQLLRELRNQTAHEYPDQPEVVIANFRHLITHVSMLKQAYAQLAAALNARIFDANQQYNG